MDFDKMTATAVRVFFFAAFVLLVFGGIRFSAGLLGIQILPTVAPERIMEYSVACVTFTVALLLRQIRDELRKP